MAPAAAVLFLTGCGTISSQGPGSVRSPAPSSVHTPVSMKTNSRSRSAAPSPTITDAGSLHLAAIGSLHLLSGTSLAVQSVQFVAPDTAFAVASGTSGHELLTTTNGGVAWRGLAAPAGLAGVDMTSDQTGWTTTCQTSGCLKPNALYHTTNGGQTWNQAALPKPGDVIDALDFATPQTGWLELAQQTGGLTVPVLYRTTNGGSTWSPESLPSTAASPWPAQLDFVNAHLGWLLVNAEPATGSEQKWLYRSENGGKSWTQIASSQAKTLPVGGYSSSMTFFNATVGYISLARGPLLKTTDGGQHWTAINAVPFDPEAFGPLNGLSFTSPATGYTVLGGVIWRTVDGGTHWDPLYPALEPMGPVSFASPNDGLAVGFNGNYNALLDTRDGGHSWEPVGSQVMQTVSMVNLNTVWGIGYTKTGVDSVLTSQDGGLKMNPVGTPPGVYPSAVATASPRNAWMIGTTQGQEAMFHTTNGGAQWTKQPLPFSAQGIAALPPNNLWSVAGTAQVSYLYHSTNGGATWSQYRIPVIGSNPGAATNIEFLNPQFGWFWSPNAIYTTRDGGKTWSVETGPSNTEIGGVDFISVQQGWVSNAQGLYETTNGGRTWIPQ